MALPNQIEDFSEDLRSGIMPVVCDLIRREPGCNLVDLGATSTANCMLFSQHGARVYLDTSLKSLRAKLGRGRGLDPPDIDGLLRHCPDAVDVLLFWDILDYVSLETVEALMQRFGGVLQPGALVYLMISQRRYIPPEPAIIDIVDEDQLRFQYGPPTLEGPHYAPKQLEQRMPGCRIDKLYLMQNGVQEHLFVYDGSA